MTPWDTLPDRGLAADMDRLQRAADNPDNFRRTYAEVVGKWGPERVQGAIGVAGGALPAGTQTLPTATRPPIMPAQQPAGPPLPPTVTPFVPPIPRRTPEPFGGNMVPPSAMATTPAIPFTGNQGAASGAPATSFAADPWGWLLGQNRQWQLRNAGNRFLSPSYPAGGQYPTGGLL